MFGNKRVKRVEIESSDELSEDSTDVAEEFSLEDLGNAYAEAIGKTSESVAIESESPEIKLHLEKSDSAGNDHEQLLNAPKAEEADQVPVTAESILEAMLFLGTSNNEPLSVARTTEILRGTTADEVSMVIDSLNQSYREHQRAFEIVKETGGYRMQLVQELSLIRDRFYGKTKETQLTQSAIDCLALVAYQPGISRAEVEKQWNQPASNMLAMLVRRGLLKVESMKSETSSELKYFTTERFLEIVGLDSLSDLPSSEEL
ncbi:MAG: SMC-Scp complex subunit ScpB [Pirellula sp.]